MHISEMQKKKKKKWRKSLLFMREWRFKLLREIQYVLTRILVIGSQSVNKQR